MRLLRASWVLVASLFTIFAFGNPNQEQVDAGFGQPDPNQLLKVINEQVERTPDGSLERARLLVSRARFQASFNHRKRAMADIQTAIDIFLSKPAVQVTVSSQIEARRIKVGLLLNLGQYNLALKECSEIPSLPEVDTQAITMGLPPSLSAEQRKTILAKYAEMIRQHPELENMLPHVDEKANRRNILDRLLDNLQTAELTELAYFGLGKPDEAGLAVKPHMTEVEELIAKNSADSLLVETGQNSLRMARLFYAINLAHAGRLDEAKEQIQSAVKSQLSGHLDADELLEALGVGKVTLKSAVQLAAAEEILDSGVTSELLRTAGVPDFSPDQSILAKAWSNQNRPDVAIFYGKLWVNQKQKSFLDAKDFAKDIGQTYRRQIESGYRTLADWLAQAGRIEEAEQVLDLLRDEEYFQFVHVRSRISDRLLLNKQEMDWKEHETRPRQKYWADLVELEKSNQTFGGTKPPLLAQVEHSLQAYQNVFGSPPKPTELPVAARNAGSEGAGEKGAVVYTVIGADSIRLMLTLPQKGQSNTFISQIESSALQKQVLDFYECLNDPSKDPKVPGSKLYDLLIRPIEPMLEGNNISEVAWNLDGNLRYIPLCALFDSRTGKYEIQMRTDTVYSRASKNAGEPNSVGPVDAVAFGVSTGATVNGVEYIALPQVPKELEVVREETGAKTYQDKAFTTERFLNELKKSDTVHVATHFQFSPGDSEDSGLLTGENRLLSVSELQALPNDYLKSVDLLVLSACQTAIGDVNADGSEFDGLARIAQNKGVRNVLATLWSVNDESTSILMSQFYDNLLAKKLSKQEALRKAQISLLTGNAKFQHPFFWAPFVLTGSAGSRN